MYYICQQLKCPSSLPDDELKSHDEEGCCKSYEEHVPRRSVITRRAYLPLRLLWCGSSLEFTQTFPSFVHFSTMTDMMKASQQAQQQMQGMTEAEKKQAMENLEKMNEQNK